MSTVDNFRRRPTIDPKNHLKHHGETPRKKTPEEAEIIYLGVGRWLVESFSHPGDFHSVKIVSDGAITCACEWGTHRAEKTGANCWHIKEVNHRFISINGGLAHAGETYLEKKEVS